MTYREIRAPLFRLATALVFVAAIGFMQDQALQGQGVQGSCEANQIPRGCDYDLGILGVWCAPEQSCFDFGQGNGYELCYCMHDYGCYWWVGGCVG